MSYIYRLDSIKLIPSRGTQRRLMDMVNEQTKHKETILSYKGWVTKDENMSSSLFSGTKKPASSYWFCRLEAIKPHPQKAATKFFETFLLFH